MKIAFLVTASLILAGCAGAPQPEKKATEATSVIIPAAEIDPKHPDFFRTHLRYYGLNPLPDSPSADVVDRYRFLWCRWLAPAALFAVEIRKDGTGEYRAMIWKEGNGKNQWVPMKTKPVTREDRDYYRFVLGKLRLFEQPYFDDRLVLDCSYWYVELVSGDKYCKLLRLSPGDADAVRAFGEELIYQAIESPLIPIN